jgi:hypothetical protein
MSLVEKVEQLNREISGSFDRAFSSLRQELQQRVRESHEDLGRRIEAFQPPVPVLAHEDFAPAADHLRGEARAGAHGELRDAFAALDRARSQSAVLAALIGGAAGFASRTAVLLWRGGELHGWGGQGFGLPEHEWADLVVAPPADSPWGRLAGPAVAGEGGAVQLSAADCAVLCERIESPIPASGVLVPLVLRDRVVAVLYADQLPQRPDSGQGQPTQPTQPTQNPALSLPALQSLAYVAALAIESLPFRQREATATLQTAGAAAAASATTAATPFVGETAPQPTAAAAAAAPAPATPEPAVTPAAASEPATPPSLASPATPETPAAPEMTAPMAPITLETPATVHEAAPSSALVAGSAGAPEPAPAAAAPSAPAPTQEETAEEGSGAAPAPAAPAAPAAPEDSREGPEPPHGPQRVAPPSRPSGPASAGGPFVSPVDLYDSPNVPLVKETAEIPVARPLWPVAAAGAETATVARAGESPYLTDTAAAAASAGGAGENETVLLPHAALREAGASPWGKKTGEAAKAPGGAGLAVLPPLPEEPETAGPAAAASGIAETPQGPEPPEPPEIIEGAVAATGATTRVPGIGGAGTLRAVPSVPPLQPSQPAAAGAAASSFGAGTQPASLSPPGLGGTFEPLRTGPLGSGTPEVRPPTGVQGPGWAFATTRIQASSSEEALHEEARRLARLLVSEIKLYNEEQVEAGRRNRDIYERLREDIDRSRQMYEERVEPRLVKATDYFYQELVRILAAGDSKALGI